MLSIEEIQGKTPSEVHALIVNLTEEKHKKTIELDIKTRTIERHVEEIERLRHQLNELIRHRFGHRSEKQVDPRQGCLFDESDLPQVEEMRDEEASITIESHERKKRGRRALPKDLPRIQQIHDLPDDEKQCKCGHALSLIGQACTEQLEFVPAQVRVIEHIQRKYACSACEETIKLAKKPEQPIPRSIATPGLLSHILVSKFCDHLPFYRQEAMLQRLGIHLSRGSLCQWAMRCGTLLAPLLTVMQSQMRSYDIGYTDETTLQVLKEEGRSVRAKSYMWLFIGGPEETRCFIYQYHPSRAHEVPEAFWGEFKGYLHTDGYGGYQTLFGKTGIQGVHCWAHARRKFMDVVKSTKSAPIARLYHLEKQMKQKEYSIEEIQRRRQKQAIPILNHFKAWLTEQLPTVPPKSPLGEAIRYTLGLWEGLVRYTQDGRLEIDNNRAERGIKPFAVGRKNWLFHDNPKGAEAGAVIYSLIETCKAHEINPYAYLKYVLTRVVECENSEDYKALLPFNVSADLLSQSWEVAS